ncbi:hypothetical protein Aperf_G00000087455 [Anoplocephala perfoliata]
MAPAGPKMKKRDEKAIVSINSLLALIFKSGKAAIGYRHTLRTLRRGGAKLIIIASNTPPLRGGSVEGEVDVKVVADGVDATVFSKEENKECLNMEEDTVDIVDKRNGNFLGKLNNSFQVDGEHDVADVVLVEKLIAAVVPVTTDYELEEVIDKKLNIGVAEAADVVGETGFNKKLNTGAVEVVSVSAAATTKGLAEVLKSGAEDEPSVAVDEDAEMLIVVVTTGESFPGRTENGAVSPVLPDGVEVTVFAPNLKVGAVNPVIIAGFVVVAVVDAEEGVKVKPKDGIVPVTPELEEAVYVRVVADGVDTTVFGKEKGKEGLKTDEDPVGVVDERDVDLAEKLNTGVELDEALDIADVVLAEKLNAGVFPVTTDCELEEVMAEKLNIGVADAADVVEETGFPKKLNMGVIGVVFASAVVAGKDTKWWC